MTPDKKEESYTETLGRAMGFFNHRGRIINKVSSTEYVMSGIKFSSLDDVDKAITLICKALNKTIR